MPRFFRTDRPHYHECERCHMSCYCRQIGCEIPQKFLCEHCANGHTLELYKGEFVYRTNKPAPLHQIDYEDEE